MGIDLIGHQWWREIRYPQPPGGLTVSLILKWDVDPSSERNDRAAATMATSGAANEAHRQLKRNQSFIERGARARQVCPVRRMI